MPTEYFKQALENIKTFKYVPVTRKMYHRAWVSFNKFVISLDRIPPTWEEKLALFLACLVQERRPPGTIKSYKSAIKAVLCDNGLELDDNQLQLAAVIKACKYMDRSVMVRLPIQRGLLRMTLDRIKDHYYRKAQVYLSNLYCAMVMTAYYGLFWIGEIAEGPHVIHFLDMHANQE